MGETPKITDPLEALVRRPSVIVMETRLPLVNGPALCEILRRDSLTRTVVVDGTHP